MTDQQEREAIKHFNDKVRNKVEGEYGPFTNADWQAFCVLDEALKKARATIPQGMRMVPVELTKEMQWAACDAADNGKFSGPYLQRIYTAMLAAAPQQPTEKG